MKIFSYWNHRVASCLCGSLFDSYIFQLWKLAIYFETKKQLFALYLLENFPIPSNLC